MYGHSWVQSPILGIDEFDDELVHIARHDQRVLQLVLVRIHQQEVLPQDELLLASPARLQW